MRLSERAAGAGGGLWDWLKQNPEAAFMAMNAVGNTMASGNEQDRWQAEKARQDKIDALRRTILDDIASSRKARDPNNPWLNMYR